ncbi:hypothetical protein ACLOJK_039091 [Asimina triloba]
MNVIAFNWPTTIDYQLMGSRTSSGTHHRFHRDGVGSFLEIQQGPPQSGSHLQQLNGINTTSISLNHTVATVIKFAIVNSKQLQQRIASGMRGEELQGATSRAASLKFSNGPPQSGSHLQKLNGINTTSISLNHTVATQAAAAERIASEMRGEELQGVTSRDEGRDKAGAAGEATSL